MTDLNKNKQSFSRKLFRILLDGTIMLELVSKEDLDGRKMEDLKVMKL